MLVCTPIDPLFLALPYLTQAAKVIILSPSFIARKSEIVSHSISKAGKFTTLEAILDDPSQTNSSQLEYYVQSEQWKHVCDVKGIKTPIKKQTCFICLFLLQFCLVM